MNKPKTTGRSQSLHQSQSTPIQPQSQSQPQPITKEISKDKFESGIENTFKEFYQLKDFDVLFSSPIFSNLSFPLKKKNEQNLGCCILLSRI